MKQRQHNNSVKEFTDSFNTLVALFNQRRYSEGEPLARQLSTRFPQAGSGWKVLGVLLKAQGKGAEALRPMQKAARLLPGDAEVHSNLGLTLLELGRLTEAEESLRRALSINPGYAEAHNNLGITLKELGRLTEAEESLRRALSLRSDFAQAHYNLGITLNKQGRLTEAEESLRRALSINPGYAEAYNTLGVTMNKQGRLTEAEESLRRALSISPGYTQAHNNLGITLKELGRLTEAEESLRRALSINPGYAEAHNNLGITLHEQGRLTEAEACCRRATEIEPDALNYAVALHLMLPIIPGSHEDILTWRERYHSGVADLAKTSCLQEDSEGLDTRSLFYLSYGNHDDRPLMERLCSLFRQRITGLTASSPHLPLRQPPAASGRRIRVGFLSQFLANHTIGRLYRGFIRHMDRNRFEVVVIHAPSAKRDSFRENLDSLADTVVALPPRLESQQQAVAALKLDVLFYPDIRMSASTYFLAYARLAPVQAVSWGHPDTTGLDTMDYFISAAPIEPENGGEYYTETLIRLNRLPCFYEPPSMSAGMPERASLGLPETGTLYGCPQSLFKFHPDFDEVLAAIAEGDPSGCIVLLEGAKQAWANSLKARWRKRFPVLLDRVRFLPFMPPDRFMLLMAHIDVLLDPVHFGSGNTLYEAMVYGTPVVTWPGRFMRGRIVAGAYRQMGIADAPIAERFEDYAPLAIALGNDPERRMALSRASREASRRELFADMLAVQEFEAFVEAAVAAAGRGEKLPPGWKPDITEAERSVRPQPAPAPPGPEPTENTGGAGDTQDNLAPALTAYQHTVLAMRQSSQIDFPAHVHLETMAVCNAKCSFCPHSDLDRKGTVMDDGLIGKVVDDLCDIPRLHNFQLSPFKVNEPFLDNRLMDLLALFQERLPNAAITLTTNASPVTEKKLAQLAAFPRIGYLWVSFNDHREAEYERTMQLPYARTLERLEMIHAAKAGQRLSARVVLSRVSDGSPADQEFALWVRTHFPLFEVSLFPRGGWIGQVTGAEAVPRAVGCTRWFDVSITATGVVAHCCMDGKAEFPIGNVRHEHVLEIYNKPEFRRLRENLNTRLEVEPCSRCGFM